MSLRRLPFLAVVAIVAVAGVAMAAKGGGGKVTLCAAADGSLRAPKSGKCDKGERKLNLYSKGRPGPAGATGVAGPVGAAGPAGAVPSLAPTRTLIGAPGPNCETTPVFCSMAKGHWTNQGKGYGPVGYQVDAGGGVHLEGTVAPNFKFEEVIETPPIFYLPPALRPSQYLVFPTRSCSGFWERIYISPDGAVEVTDLDCAPLDGIVFHP